MDIQEDGELRYQRIDCLRRLKLGPGKELQQRHKTMSADSMLVTTTN